MVIIRLARRGAKKCPCYDVVVTDSRNPRDGKFIEKVGYFNEVARGEATPLALKIDRIEHWIKNGAQTSPRVKTLIKHFKKTKKAD
jgi:small subunit ribosomal protein S16